jgi:hypothetical protein
MTKNPVLMLVIFRGNEAPGLALGLTARPFLVAGRSVDLAALEQFALAGTGQLFPGSGHLFQLLAVSRWCGTRHFPTFRGVFAILVQFFHRIIPPSPVI